MGQERFSLKELSELSGVLVRTIRSYIQQGLLAGPDNLGRNASYTIDHLRRLEAIKALREKYGMSLDEVRRRLLTLGPEDILREDRTLLTRLAESPPSESAGKGSALEYIRAIKSRAAAARSGSTPHLESPAAADFLPSPDTGLEGRQVTGDSRTSLERLLAKLRTGKGGARPSRGAKAATWTEVEVTPDIVLRFRGDFSRDEIVLFSQIADEIRDLLLEGEGNDKDQQP